MKNWRLKHRILLLALAPVWLISILLTLLAVLVGITEIDGALKARGGVIARQLAPASEYGAFSGNREVLQALTLAVMKEDDARAVLITDRDHKVLALSGSPSPFSAQHARAAEQGQILAGLHGTLIFGMPIYQGRTDGDAFDLFDQSGAAPAAPPKLLGYVYLELSTTSSRHSKTVFIALSLLIGMIGMACASVLALRMSRDLTRPLSHLLDGVHSMARGKLETRIAANSGGELEALENGFNLMAAKLQHGRDAMLEVNANLERLVAERTAELEVRNRELEQLSVTDRLTGLYNRLKLERILELEYARCLRYGSNFSLGMLDIDKFKSVNDSYGHPMGDQVLITIAGIISENTRSMDAVGRWGGEEFLLIFRETSLDAAVATAEKLRCAIAGHPLPDIGNMSASFGISAYRPGDSISDMIVRADDALYQAKHHGRNRVEFLE
ncbi:MAG: diguanylate cyclase [Burkholderiales bacterium]|nr:diguanylate cyclase [Burkholderiales bacterium]